ncbi:Zinc/iron permease [Ophiocordyceps camponoti-floridani]|uniref:Zinc/iron permease n=1 Tax=Ophiocordyceps camponoti-floridani TaxID=2030778 RepID=A0A8H4QDA7_9HYPO|nr:Zinc/iron permease [Ophiocordyceps camponoti-floridani]
MICLNKADEAFSRHLAFNQSPPALAPNRTTRQDLNGISNLRQYVAAGQDLGPDQDPFVGSSRARPDTDHHDSRPEPLAVEAGAPGPCCCASSSPASHQTGAGGEGRFRLSWLSSQPERLWTLTAWVLSLVLLVRVVPVVAAEIGRWRAAAPTSAPAPTPVPIPAPTPAPAPILKRATCRVGGLDHTVDYNTPLHVGALLIIWTVSTLGCSFPIMAAKLPWLRIPRRFFFAVRHFGTGVLIATAFVHLLPTAFVSLGNPCLGSFWTTQYQAMPGAIALASIFLVMVIEMMLHPSRHVPSSASVIGHSSGSDAAASGSSGPSHHLCSSTAGLPFGDLMGSRSARSTTLALGLTQLKNSPVVEGAQEEVGHLPAVSEHKSETDVAVSTESRQTSPELARRKERLQCILLEMGILFHSVFIGMAVSVSVGADFVVLLIAIVFHQTFEGLALGARISAIEWGSKSWQPWCMALAYGCTTPLGQAIGLATHTLYSPDSEVGLIVVGVMNAISAGLLTFASLVELLSEDFLSDHSWRILRGRQRVIACVLVFFGAFFMSLVGAWA